MSLDQLAAFAHSLMPVTPPPFSRVNSLEAGIGEIFAEIRDDDSDTETVALPREMEDHEWEFNGQWRSYNKTISAIKYDVIHKLVDMEINNLEERFGDGLFQHVHKHELESIFRSRMYGDPRVSVITQKKFKCCKIRTVIVL